MISLFKDFKTPKASISYSVNSFYIYSHSEAGIALQEKKLWENCRVALWVGAVISKSTGSFAFWSLRDRPCSHQKMYDKNKKKKHEKKKKERIGRETNLAATFCWNWDPPENYYGCLDQTLFLKYPVRLASFLVVPLHSVALRLLAEQSMLELVQPSQSGLK